MLATEARTFLRVMKQVDGSIEPYPNMLEEIIGALYRRIEKLEEEKASLIELAEKHAASLEASIENHLRTNEKLKLMKNAAWQAANDALDAGPRKGA